MAFINTIKSFSTKSECDLFTTKSTQNCVESGQFLEYRPVSVLSSEGPIEFYISSSDLYLDLSHTQIQVKARILKEDGSVLKPEDSVAPVNNFLNSLFEHVSIELNNKTITTPSNSYHYRSYIETLLNYSHEAKSTHLLSSLFVKDQAGRMDDVEGSGFVARKKFLKDGAIELSGYIHSELMSQEKFLINGVNIRLKFYRSKPGFSLLTTAADKSEYKIDISEAILLVRKVSINPSVMLAHERTLLRSNIKMPINRVDLKILSVAGDMQTKMIDNIYIGELFTFVVVDKFHEMTSFMLIGQMPKRLIIGLVSAAAVNSSLKKNPYNFRHFNHNHILLSSDSHTNIRPIKSNFDKNIYLQAYLSLFSSSGINFSDAGNDVTREEYPNGFALLGWDLTEDLSASDNHLSIPQQGSMRIDLQFEKTLEETINIIVYAEFNSLIEIDKDRNIILDYAS
jgi:hypothetical protein